MVLDLPPLRDFEHVIAVVLGPQRARVRQGRIEPKTVEVIAHIVMVLDCFCRSASRRACFFHLTLPGPCLLGLRGTLDSAPCCPPLFTESPAAGKDELSYSPLRSQLFR